MEVFDIVPPPWQTHLSQINREKPLWNSEKSFIIKDL